MKSTPLLFVSLCILYVACDTKPAEEKYVIGKADSLHSEVLKENRKFFVYLPPSYGDGSDTTKRYPVVYLLDGGVHFHSLTGLLDQLTMNELCPEMIVVAIINTDRSRDLTPSRSLKLPNGETREWLSTTGGADNFLMFIRSELFPYIEKKYPTEPYRILIGHSFGGLLAIHTLLNQTEMFNAYVAIDPSMWWDNRRLLIQADSILRQRSFQNKRVFVSVANTMPTGMDTLRVNSDTTGNTAHIRSILELCKLSNSVKASNGMNFAWKYYGEDSHGSVPLISEYDALRYMFRYYRMAFDPEQTADDVARHFQMVSSNLGYSKLPPEGVVSERGYINLDQKKYDRAKGFFELNLNNYKGSANAQAGMGDYHLALGDTTRAAEFYSRALQLKEVPDIRSKLKTLSRKRK